jgi:hypothetical protein
LKLPPSAMRHPGMPVTLPTENVNDWINPQIVEDNSLADAMVDVATPMALIWHDIRSPIAGDDSELVKPVSLL